MNNQKKKLGELLIEAGLIDHMQLKAALAYQREWGGRIGAALIRKGFVNEADMTVVLEKQLGMPCIPVEVFEKPTDELLRLLKEDIARKFGVFPLKYEGRTLSVATSDPTDLKMLDDLGFLLGVRVKAVLGLESDITSAIDHFYDPACTGERLCRKIRKPAAPQPKADADFEIFQGHDEPEETVFKNWDLNKEEDYHAVLHGVVQLLIEAGIFTHGELLEKIRKRKQ